MNLIEVKNLTKTFKVRKKKKGFKNFFKREYDVVNAVNNISFSVKKGESVAFIGPNGAGKSTTIKMLTGILFPTSGDISVFGLNPSKDRVKLSYKIGSMVGQKEQLWVHLSPYDNFKFFGAIYNINKKELDEKIENYSKLFEISSFLHQPVKSLSLGQRMKCEMVASLLHDPEMLFFDEPTIGLDPIAKETLRNLIKKINKELGATIFFTSHDVGDIEEVCKRVIIVNHGKIVLDDSMESLKYHYLNRKIVEVKFKDFFDLKEKDGCKILKATGNAYKIEVDLTKTSINDVMKMFDADLVQDITINSIPLEEIIKEVYRDTNA